MFFIIIIIIIIFATQNDTSGLLKFKWLDSPVC